MADPSVVFPLSILPSATTILISEGKVYAFLRLGKVLNGFMGTPGGKHEFDKAGVPQRAVEVAADELFQEAGIDVRNELGRLSFLNAVLEPSDKGIFLCHVFLMHLKKGEVPQRLEPEKHSEFELLPPEGYAGRKLLPSLEMTLAYLKAHPEVLNQQAQHLLQHPGGWPPVGHSPFYYHPAVSGIRQQLPALAVVVGDEVPVC